MSKESLRPLGRGLHELPELMKSSGARVSGFRGSLRCGTWILLCFVVQSLNAKCKILRSGVTNDMHSISPCGGCVGEGIRAQVTWSEAGASHCGFELQHLKARTISTPPKP